MNRLIKNHNSKSIVSCSFNYGKFYKNILGDGYKALNKILLRGSKSEFKLIYSKAKVTYQHLYSDSINHDVVVTIK